MEEKNNITEVEICRRYGHKFEPRFDEFEKPSADINMFLEKVNELDFCIDSSDLKDILEKFVVKEKIYVAEVCTACGLFAKYSPMIKK